MKILNINSIILAMYKVITAFVVNFQNGHAAHQTTLIISPKSCIFFI